MYIYDFITSLDLLKKEHMPISQEYPHDAIYYGYATKEEVKERGILCDDKNENYLIYSIGQQIHNLYALGVDQELNYIQKLNAQGVLISRTSLFYLSTAFYEVFRLYDEFSYLSVLDNPFFDVSFQGGIDLIASLFHDNACQGEPSLLLLQNNPIKKDILIAQFRYFVTAYVQKRLKTNKSKASSRPQNYELTLKNTLRKYRDEVHSGYRISTYTGFENEEFDNFLQQIQNLPISNHEL